MYGRTGHVFHNPGELFVVRGAACILHGCKLSRRHFKKCIADLFIQQALNVSAGWEIPYFSQGRQGATAGEVGAFHMTGETFSSSVIILEHASFF